MVLCYEKKTLYSLCKTHISFIIYNKNVELSKLSYSIQYIVFFTVIFYLCTTP